MASALLDGEAVVIVLAIAAALSLIGCTVIFISFSISKEWRAEFEKRFLLFMMTIYMTILAGMHIMAVVDLHDDLWCKIQNGLYHSVGVIVLFHEAMISYELFHEMDKLEGLAEGSVLAPPVSVVDVDDSLGSMLATIPWRLAVFEVLCLMYGVGSMCISLLVSPVPSNGMLCVSDITRFSSFVVFFFLTVYLPIFLCAVFSAIVIYRLFNLLRREDSFAFFSYSEAENSCPAPDRESLIDAVRLSEQEEEESATSTYWRFRCCGTFRDGMGRLDERSRATVIRIILISLFYGLIPISWFALTSLSFHSRQMAVMVMFALGGFVNAIVWVAANKPILRLWKVVLLRWCCGKVATFAPDIIESIRADSALRESLYQSNYRL